MTTVGIPKETKQGERRVSLTPSAVAMISGPSVIVNVESDAGEGAGFTNEDYYNAGATIVDDVWHSDVIVKVKEPQRKEIARIRRTQTIFGYFHFASDIELTRAMLHTRATAFAYETLEHGGRLPLLDPMSDIAGRVCLQRGAMFYPALFGGVAGTPRTRVLVVGAGVVGTSAANMARNMGASVTVADIDIKKLYHFESQGFDTMLLPDGKVRSLVGFNVLVGAVHIPGMKTPHIASREVVQELGKNGLVIDVSIDQGGCLPDSRPTSHGEPTYKVDDVTYYCVANLPGAVPMTSSVTLSNALVKFVKELAECPAAFAQKYDTCHAMSNKVIIDPRIVQTFPELKTEFEYIKKFKGL